jgi:hypothetical protein
VRLRRPGPATDRVRDRSDCSWPSEETGREAGWPAGATGPDGAVALCVPCEVRRRLRCKPSTRRLARAPRPGPIPEVNCRTRRRSAVLVTVHHGAPHLAVLELLDGRAVGLTWPAAPGRRGIGALRRGSPPDLPRAHGQSSSSSSSPGAHGSPPFDFTPASFACT